MAGCIILIGFMGAGKSTVGKLLAESLKYDFIDTDVEIEKKHNMRISDMFSKYGEAYFRKLEKEYINSILGDTPIVISCGGGSVIDADNVNKLKSLGKIIYLRANEDTILTRTAGNNDRPLLVRENLSRLLAVRDEIYSNCCDECIDTDEYNTKKTVEILMRIV